MPAAAAWSRAFPRWGTALRDQNDDSLVRCGACDRVGTLQAPTGADRLKDREHWPSVPCVFTPGCEGAIEPEPLN